MNNNPEIFHEKLYDRTERKLAFSKDADYPSWREAVRRKLTELLGMANMPEAKGAPEIRIEAQEEHPDFTETQFQFESEPDYFVPCHLLIPKRGQKPFPVMICLQGHSTGMHISLGETKYPKDEIHGDRDFVRHAISHGHAALVLEQRCFGEQGCNPETGSPNCGQATMVALLLGRTTLAGRVWDVMRAIDMAEAHFSPGAQYGCMGNSGGGTVTWYAAALEPRIAWAMPSCAICNYEGSIAPIHHCVCNYVPGIRRWFEMGDLAGLIAPRPLVVVAGLTDRIFPIDATRETFRLIQSYYAAAGAPDACRLHVGGEGHRFYAEAWEDLVAL